MPKGAKAVIRVPSPPCPNCNKTNVDCASLESQTFSGWLLMMECLDCSTTFPYEIEWKPQWTEQR